MTLQESCVMESESYDLDIEADDIDVEDTVTVVWRIENSLEGTRENSIL